MISKIYNSNQILYKANTLKGKSKKEIEDMFTGIKVSKKNKFAKVITPLEKRKAELAKQYKDKIKNQCF